MSFFIVAIVTGFLFGLGVTIAGMTQPQKVIGFLDFFGHWDPTLIFVMAGGIAVHFISYLFVKKRASPFFASKFLIPDAKQLDKKLIAGSALFGIGWGIAGYCPGPAIASLSTGRVEILVFVLFMAAGMLAHEWINKRSAGA